MTGGLTRIELDLTRIQAPDIGSNLRQIQTMEMSDISHCVARTTIIG